MASNTSDRIDALPIATSLRGYVIERVIAHGGFGIVYLARHIELGGQVAIKEYMPSFLAVRRANSVSPMSSVTAEHYEEGLWRFLEEARQLVRFDSHPSVVSCRDFFRENGTAYLVMEYVEGLTLAELLQRREQHGRPFDESELMAIGRPLLEGLMAVHDAGVLHRDIKPANILVRRSDEQPVLIDFGAAKHYVAEHSSSVAPYTEGYAANEQISEGGRLGPWTDLYAFGGVLWRIVAGGNPPWEDPRWRELNWRPPNPLRVELRMRAVGRGEADPLPSAREVGAGRFSGRTLTAIDRCLKVWEEDRVQDCGQLLEFFRSHPTKSAATSADVSRTQVKDDEQETSRITRYVPESSSLNEIEESTKQTSSIGRFIIRFVSGLFVFLFYFSGKGMFQEARNIEAGYINESFVFALAFHFISMALFYTVFCRWSRTRLSPTKNFEESKIRLAVCWATVGFFILPVLSIFSTPLGQTLAKLRSL